MGALHGVDGHFDLVPPPTPARSGRPVSLRVGIGSELAARSAGDALLRIEQSRDANAIAPAIRAVLADNPDADLLEIEQMLRAAASTAYLVATAEGFMVVVDMNNWIAELARLGRTPEQNRQLLAGEPARVSGCLHGRGTRLFPGRRPRSA